MEAYAIHKNALIKPRLARMTMDLIRGKDVETARGILENTNTKASRLILKVLNSAVANAENNFALDTDKLYVSEAYVGQGPTLKRFRPMDHGKAFRINKRTSHITVVVKERA